MSRYHQFFLFMLAASLCFLSCNESGSKEIECLSRSDCPSGQECINQQCQGATTCSTDSDCPPATYCEKGSCISAQSCGSWTDCPTGFDCVNSICKPLVIDNSCTTDDDCSYGFHCETFSQLCVEDPQDVCQSDNDCAPGFTCKDGQCELKPIEDGDQFEEELEVEVEQEEDGDQEIDDTTDEPTLCEPCEQDSDCKADMTAFCMEDTFGNKHCGQFCDAENICPDDYICREVSAPDSSMVGQCLPSDGVCGDATDGDDDGEEEQNSEPCTGECNQSVNVDLCYGEELCICDNNQFNMLDCSQWCIDNGYTGFERCGHDNDLNHSKCFCTGDNPDTDFCTGYTGSNECCTPDNNCNYDNDNVCQCDGSCSWEEDDCSGSSTDGSGTCEDPFVVDSFPYSHSHTTVGHESNMTAFFCDSGDGSSHSSNGPEVLYKIYGTVGLKLSLDLVNSSFFDPVLISTVDCADNFASCYAINETSSGDNEGAWLEFSQTGYATIAVDTAMFTGGSYTLNITVDTSK